MNQSEKQDSAMILASNRRVSRAGFMDSRPCRICSLDKEIKDVIEGLLGTGLAQRPILDLANSILDIKDPGNNKLSMRTLEQHRKNHIPIRLFMQREVVERRAKAASIDIENHEGSIITPASYAEIMMNAGATNLLDNPEAVSPMEGLAAAKTLHEFDSKDKSDLDVARMASDLNKIILAVKAVCAPNQIQTIIQMINADTPKDDDDVDIIQ